MKEEIFDLVVVGGGAGGFFGAIIAAERNPGLSVLILEKSSKTLSKVKVSGGGRCNVTHQCFNPFELAHHYPRGEKSLKEMFKRFQASDMVEWLRAKGVLLKAEDDGRMFPTTDDSQTIIDCFLSAANRFGIRIKLHAEVESIENESGRFKITCNGSAIYFARKVLIASGGSPKLSSYKFLEKCGHTVLTPIPSLFTFNDPDKMFSDLMGVSVPLGEVKIVGTKFHQQGPILITHWGLSGPAVIKLSAWAASFLFEKNYEFSVHVNWTSIFAEEQLREKLSSAKAERPKQRIYNYSPFALPTRLWEKICYLSKVEPEKVWGEVSSKTLNRLVENTFRCPFKIRGKTTFKEEFVTCGGVDLADVNLQTMESRRMPGLFFAGEVLNIDGETGGFNFQAAWTTAFIAGLSIAKETPAGSVRGSFEV